MPPPLQSRSGRLKMHRIHLPFFRIFYSTTFTVLFLSVVVLLAVTPADHIYQIISDHKVGNIFVVGGAYVVTGILVVFIYASRLYTNRSVLAAIPRSYLPIGKGEVTRNVYRMIVQNRERSAIVAYQSRPRDLREEHGQQSDNSHDAGDPRPRSHGIKDKANSGDAVIPVFAGSPPWGLVMHPGWSSPSSEDLPSLQFETVVCELPNLIEAKAVSLAPPDPAFNFMAEFHDTVLPPSDPQAVALLQRPSTSGLRDYLMHLDDLGLIGSTTVLSEFMSQYEYARFSTDELTEIEFRRLMAIFAELLAGMNDLHPTVLEEAHTDEVTRASSIRSVQRTPSMRPAMQTKPSSTSISSSISAQSVVHHIAPTSPRRPP